MRLTLALVLPLLAACVDPPPPEPKAPPPNTDAVKRDLPMRPPGGAPDGVIGNMAPRITRVSIEPAEPNTATELTARAEAQDSDTPNVDLDFLWIINGQERPDLSLETLDPEEFDKGDKIAVKVVARDGDNEVDRTSAEVLIRNSAPAFVGDPRASSQIDGLTLKAEDPDGDSLTFSLSGQPDGMEIDPQRGRISYKGSTSEKGGDYQIAVKVSDGDGGEARWEFGISISPGMTAEEQQKKAEEERAAAAAGG